jgi:hypothetical protein
MGSCYEAFPIIFGFIVGNKRTSLMEFVLVKIMHKRSIPSPHPAVGGSPYQQKVNSEILQINNQQMQVKIL